MVSIEHASEIEKVYFLFTPSPPDQGQAGRIQERPGRHGREEEDASLQSESVAERHDQAAARDAG